MPRQTNQKENFAYEIHERNEKKIKILSFCFIFSVFSVFRGQILFIRYYFVENKA
jgi:hypothetical protein